MTQVTQDIEAVRRELADLRTQVAALAGEHQSDSHSAGRPAGAAPDAPAPTDHTPDSERKVAEAVAEKVVMDHLAGMVQGAAKTEPVAAMIIGLVLGDRTGRWRSVNTRGPIGPVGDIGKAARVFAALGHETRLRVLQLLWGGERTAQDLSEGTGLSAGALYHHVRELAAFRWVETPRRNAYVITPAGRQALVCAWEFSRFLIGRSRLGPPGAPHPEANPEGFELEPPEDEDEDDA